MFSYAESAQISLSEYGVFLQNEKSTICGTSTDWLIELSMCVKHLFPTF